MESIQNRILKTELVDIDRLTPFQGRLKTLSDANFNKLRKSIMDEGFSFTMHVWENADVIYMIDGHQRLSVLTQMRKQGIIIPPLSCSFVSAKTYRDAKKLVLAAISQFGKIQKDGFLEFVQGEDFDFDDYDFPNLDFNIDEVIKLKPEMEPDQDGDDESEQDPIDDIPESAPSRCNLGDVWKLGNHVLVCGDSGNRQLVHSIVETEQADAIVTDPPYGLSFMGKEWDRGVPSKELWDVWHSRLKPGGHMLSFSGTRTYHLMTVAIENAGFEVRDMMQWIYGQGFPKSHDISKAIDEAAGAEREVVGKNKRSQRTGNEGWDRPWKQKQMADLGGSGMAEFDITAPATPDAQKWSGWGTALKPANEPICLARKPCSEKTVAANVLKHGTGGLNIDGTRIETTDNLNGGTYSKNAKDLERESQVPGNGIGREFVQPEGRFPSNVIFDEAPDEVLDGQSGVTKSNIRISEDKDSQANTYSLGRTGTNPRGHADSGGSSRFFYVAKPSKSERGKENHHATVKPVSLMQYLVRMITQPGGLVLEPFAGSGTTLLACEKEGMRCIGFELDPKHCDIILSRWEGMSKQSAVKVG